MTPLTLSWLMTERVPILDPRFPRWIREPFEVSGKSVETSKAPPLQLGQKHARLRCFSRGWGVYFSLYPRVYPLGDTRI